MEETLEESDLELSAQIDELGNLVGVYRNMDESDSGFVYCCNFFDKNSFLH